MKKKMIIVFLSTSISLLFSSCSTILEIITGDRQCIYPNCTIGKNYGKESKNKDYRSKSVATRETVAVSREEFVAWTDTEHVILN